MSSFLDAPNMLQLQVLPASIAPYASTPNLLIGGGVLAALVTYWLEMEVVAGAILALVAMFAVWRFVL